MFIQKKSMQSYKGMLLILFILTMLSSAAHAAVIQSVTGKLKLFATIDSRPAFSSVIWKISSDIAGTKKLIKTIRQHTASLELPPGTYQVIVSSKHQAETHNITILERTPYSLIVNLNQ